MKREQLINKYQDMMYKYGEYDIWDCDIEPHLDDLSTEEIRSAFNKDKEYFESREQAGGYWE